ncbi:oxygenase MpaB family protein [Lysobacter sp. LF1]|uniref:Oxygenase MpaB family protein n=1 Tax=Lysobacter stagni TaxID=3045172 RepID=A0ABT6XJ02_9GAMM|nr:oxygenase MpaB family protein [Lysobacter sp. LF1]MDI9240141.1 oxygenase MpaB family protein [Lysobacter sp. LF1]
MPLTRALAAPAAARIRHWVLSAFPRGQSGIDYDHPAGDPGLFGPDSITWRVHSDFPGMLSGGLCALMLQTLHPLALAGVWDHSNFRTDLIGRLRRTTNFVAGTTYASRSEAHRLIAHVADIHQQVHGTLPDGRSYRADDPQLLTWVHVTESFGFLEGFRRYSPLALPPGAADRYYDEARRVAEALGARDVPASEAQVQAYFERIQPQLRFDGRSREVLDVLARIELPVPARGITRDLFLGAGAALLPDWALASLRRTAWQNSQAAVSARMLRAIAPLFRIALDDGVAPRACRRVGVAADTLEHWPRARAA